MSELKLKLFRATKRVEPEWGKSSTEWIQYFDAPSREVVEQVLTARYGKLDRYYRYDESRERIIIEEIEVECL